jgi:hypothetical protein
MKRPLLIALVGLAILVGAYCFGRSDSPGKGDYATKGLIDGLNAYREKLEAMAKERAALIKSRDQALRKMQVVLAEADSIHRLRVPLPAEVPPSCKGWADNLDRCDQELVKVKHSLLETRDAMEATAKLQTLADRRAGTAEARADSSEKALKREVGKSKILGIQLPSRKTSFLAGTAAGAVLCALFCPK